MPSRPPRAAVTTAAVIAVLFVAEPSAAAARGWWPPVPGAAVVPFAFDRTAPFARGAHRGADLAARPGEAVRAPCRGRVSHAGRVPGHDHGVTVRCGRLVATVLELRALRVRRGAEVVRGAVVGIARAGHVHLGARRAGDRHGYVDPVALLDAPGTPGPGALPLAGPRRPVPLRGPHPVPSAPPPARAEAPGPSAARAPARAPEPARAPASAPAPAAVPAAPSPHAAPAGTPPVAWIGLGLLAAATPLGTLWRRRGRPDRRRRAEASPSRAG